MIEEGKVTMLIGVANRDINYNQTNIEYLKLLMHSASNIIGKEKIRIKYKKIAYKFKTIAEIPMIWKSG